MDDTDLRLLRTLQRDSNRPVAELGQELGMSASACHRRIKAMESRGLIQGYTARISRRKLGFNLLIFVDITLRSQERAVLDDFEAAVCRTDEIIECHLTSGQADYSLRVVAHDMDDYDRIHRERLAALPNVAMMHTTFALRPIKHWRGFPI